MVFTVDGTTLNYKLPDFDHKYSETDALLFTSSSTVETTIGFFSVTVILQNVILLINMLIQLGCLYVIKTDGLLKLGSFYIIICILSNSVAFRVLFSITALSMASVVDEEGSVYYGFLQSSLYVDYCSNFLSLTTIFCMSLNRCSCFVAEGLNGKLFDGKRVMFPIMTSCILAFIGAVFAIKSSNIIRFHVPGTGFVDIAKKNGYEILINRLFYVFPFGSIVFYMILYCHFHKSFKCSRKLFKNTNYNGSRGAEKVFIQLLFTAILYFFLSVFYEILTWNNWESQSSLIPFISILNTCNYLPEVWIPLSVLCSSSFFRKRFSRTIAPIQMNNSRAIVGRL